MRALSTADKFWIGIALLAIGGHLLRHAGHQDQPEHGKTQAIEHAEHWHAWTWQELMEQHAMCRSTIESGAWEAMGHTAPTVQECVYRRAVCSRHYLDVCSRDALSIHYVDFEYDLKRQDKK